MLKRASRRERLLVDCDLVVVGAGPAHLVQAINAAAEGQSVLILEQHGHLGGAWAAVASFDDDLHRYEVVPHHLSPYLDAYEMLEEVGIELEPRPIHAWDHQSLSRDQRRWYRDNYTESFPVGEADRARLVHEDQWYSFRDSQDPDLSDQIEYRKGFHRDVNANICYFANGVQDLIDRFTSRLRQVGCSVMTNTAVSEVGLGGSGTTSDRPVVWTEDHRIHADRVLLGQHFSGQLSITGLPVEPAKTTLFTSLLVKVRLAEQQSVRYVNVKDDSTTPVGPISYIHLTRSQLRVLDDDIFVYCIGGSFDSSGPARGAADEILRRMRRVGIIEGDYEIWDARWRSLEVKSQTGDFCVAVGEATGGRIEMSHVAALGQEISINLTAWRSALAIRP